MKLISAVTVWILFSTFAYWCREAKAEKGDIEEAEKLLRQAEELTNIRSYGAHPFRLTARVKLYDEKDQTQEGTYDLLWKSPTAWRDEITFSDFSQIRVADADRLLISRNPPFLTFEIFRSLQLLDFPNCLRFTQEAKAQKLRKKATSGSQERSIEIVVPGGPPWKSVFLDNSSPLPIRLKYKGSHSGYRFQDYAEFDGHQFPRTLVEFDSDKPLIRIEIKELADATFDANFLAPPPDAKWIHWCQQPQHAKLVDGKGYATWPLTKPVTINGIIGTDGQWHNLTVVKSAGQKVDSYWIDVMRQQRFYPAKCGDSPVEEEVVLKLANDIILAN